MNTNTLNIDFQIRAATGYAELGMNREALREIRLIAKECRYNLLVIGLRLHHLMRTKRWKAGLALSRCLCVNWPEEKDGFLHASFCLHKLGDTHQARKVILEGPVDLLNEDSTFHYNLACFETRLGKFESAKVHLKRSFQLNKAYRTSAKEDPDLEPLRKFLAKA